MRGRDVPPEMSNAASTVMVDKSGLDMVVCDDLRAETANEESVAGDEEEVAGADDWELGVSASSPKKRTMSSADLIRCNTRKASS